MVKIIVEIDCGNETCANCQHRFYMNVLLMESPKGCNGLCGLFNKNVRGKLDFDHWQDSTRLPECIAREVPPEIDISVFKFLKEHIQKSEYPPLTTEEIDELLAGIKELNAKENKAQEHKEVDNG